MKAEGYPIVWILQDIFDYCADLPVTSQAPEVHLFPVGFVDDGSHGSFHPGLLRDFELVDGHYIQSSQAILWYLLVNKAFFTVQRLYLCPLLFHKVAVPGTNNLARGLFKFSHNIILLIMLIWHVHIVIPDGIEDLFVPCIVWCNLFWFLYACICRWERGR